MEDMLVKTRRQLRLRASRVPDGGRGQVSKMKACGFALCARARTRLPINLLLSCCWNCIILVSVKHDLRRREAHLLSFDVRVVAPRNPTALLRDSLYARLDILPLKSVSRAWKLGNETYTNRLGELAWPGSRRLLPQAPS